MISPAMLNLEIEADYIYSQTFVRPQRAIHPPHWRRSRFIRLLLRLHCNRPLAHLSTNLNPAPTRTIS